jgi:transposase
VKEAPMKPKQDTKVEADKLVRDIKRATRRKFSAEEKIRIVLAGLRGEDSIAELCRREGLHQNLYYRWSKEFLEAGEKRLVGDTEREASRADVSELRKESGFYQRRAGVEFFDHTDRLKGELGW